MVEQDDTMAMIDDYDPIDVDSEQTIEADENPLSENERYENYMFIVSTIQSLQTTQRITEDWMQYHMHAILRWRSWIPNFSEVNEDREDEEFRKLCARTETLMDYVVGQIRERKSFEVIFYLHLLQCMKQIIDMLQDETDLSDMLNSMSMK
jgi:hypothetical protein